MTQCSPNGGLQWTKTISFDVDRDTSPTASHEYILRVDLGYPKSLYDSQDEYALKSELILVNNIMLSRYCLKIKNIILISDSKAENLVSKLNNNSRYVPYYQTFSCICNME